MLKEYSEKVNLAIEDYLKTLPDSGIYLPFKYIMNLGGKRFRPSLLLMSTALFEGSIDEAISPAIGIEVFHNFTLVHDDIMDAAPLRRGKKPVHLKWDLNMGILSGDVMFAQANQLIASCFPHHLKNVIQLYNKTAIEVCEGQDLDMQFESRANVSLNDYLEMIKLKTAVLVACALKIGAFIGDADDQDAELIYDFGIYLGIAFQVHDDILDVYGNQENFGKQVGGDIIEGKHTVLMILAKNKASQTQEEELKQLLDNTALKDELKVAKVTAIYDELNVKQEAVNIQHEYFEKALTAVSNLSLQDHKKEQLFSFSRALMNRVV